MVQPKPNDRVRIRASGDMALFTRPEFKTERVSYDVMTPTSAVGLFESILYKPEFDWRITEIAVLKPIQFTSIRRNEVKNAFPSRWSGDLPTMDISDSANRVQRHSLLLRDVDYVVEAQIVLKPGTDPKNTVIKYREMFVRRVLEGQHFRVPFFGCREFVADIRPPGDYTPIAEDRVFGMMPLKMAWTKTGPVPTFFPAMMRQGVIKVPVS